MTALAAGFVLGLAGSAHCLGMCGPLVLVAGRSGAARPSLGFAVHHGARLLVYLAAGALAGYGGSLIAQAGWRRGLALAAGVILLAQATGALGAVLGAAPGRVVGRVTLRAARILPRHPLARAAALGLFNGLMPCGLLYGALAAAAGLGDPATAIAFVAAFGVGSLPAFAALIYSAHTFGPRLPWRLRQAGPVALALVGLLLIARAWAPDAHLALHWH